MKRFLAAAAIAVAAFASTPAWGANTWGTDMSDLWWNRNESGWGANIVHQDDIIFLTIFVYGADARARWFVAPAMDFLDVEGSFAFRGGLYETTGPVFFGPFDPATVGARMVGTATLDFNAINLGMLTYTVDGVSVSKAIQRQTFRSNNLSGNYIGVAIGSTFACGANSGPFASYARFAITQSGATISIEAAIGSRPSCTYSGTYSQAGRMGTIIGNVACTNGARASFIAYEIEAGYQDFSLNYSADYGNGCTEAGSLGAMK